MGKGFFLCILRDGDAPSHAQALHATGSVVCVLDAILHTIYHNAHHSMLGLVGAHDTYNSALSAEPRA